MLKFLLKKIWSKLIYLLILFSNNFNLKVDSVKVFYGGARSGNVGGPLVKIKRLKKYFPEKLFCFNIVYLLSNSPFLSDNAIKKLKSRHVPIILNQNGIFFPGWFHGDWKKMNKIMSKSYVEADYVFWQSKFCKYSAQRFLTNRSGPGEILYNCVDTNFFIPKSNFKNQNFKFLITGKIDVNMSYRVIAAIKGLAFANKKGYKFDLILAGKIEKKVLANFFKLAEHLDIKDYLFYKGTYNQNNAPKIYQSSDAYIMLKYKDPSPNVVIEAMSCGLPILFSLSGGVPELVGEKSGVGLKVKDTWTRGDIVPKTNHIGEGMIKIFKKHKFFALNARKRAVQKFDIAHWIERHQIIFDQYLIK